MGSGQDWRPKRFLNFPGGGGLRPSTPLLLGGRMRINRPKHPTLIRYDDNDIPIDHYRKSRLPKFGTNNPIQVLRKMQHDPNEKSDESTG